MWQTLFEERLQLFESGVWKHLHNNYVLFVHIDVDHVLRVFINQAIEFFPDSKLRSLKSVLAFELECYFSERAIKLRLIIVWCLLIRTIK